MLIGIMFGQYFPQREGTVIFLLLSVTLSVIFAIRFGMFGLSLLPIAAIAGFVTMFNYCNIDVAEEQNWIKNDAVVFAEGRVISKSRGSDDSMRIVADCRYIRDDNIEKAVKYRLLFYDDTDLDVGQKFVVMGRLHSLGGSMNISDTDYSPYYLSRKIRYGIDVINITSIGSPKGILYAMARLRARFSDVYDQILPVNEAGIIKAIVLGDKTDLDDDIYQKFKTAGIAHIVAVSGLHIGIFSGLLLFLIRPLPKTVSVYITIFILGLYCMFTGCSPSAVRAFVMIVILFGGKLLHRDYDIVSSACLAAIIMLLYSPFYIYDLGFQYSFCAVLGIGLINDIIIKYGIKNKILQAVLISLAAGTATKPISVLSSSVLNVVDIFANLLVTGFMSVVFTLGLVGGILGGVSIHLGRIAAAPVYALLKYFLLVCDVMDKCSLTHIAAGHISMGMVIFIYFLFVFIYNAAMDIKNSYAGAVAVSLMLTGGTVLENKGFRMDFLYVGQGDCCVLTTEDSCCIFDGGDNRYKNYGQYNLLPFLHYSGVSEVDSVYISHTDADHIGGIAEIMDDIRINDIYFSNKVTKNEYYYTVCDLAEKYGTNIHYMSKYDKNNIDSVTVECIYEGLGTGDNNNSMVLKVEYDGLSVLMTGDIEAAAEAELDSGADADVLKVPHHGSSTSSSQYLIDCVTPHTAIVSAGVDNMFNHPRQNIVNRYKDNGIRLFSTNSSGQITLTEGFDGFNINCFIGGYEYETD